MGILDAMAALERRWFASVDRRRVDREERAATCPHRVEAYWCDECAMHFNPPA